MSNRQIELVEVISQLVITILVGGSYLGSDLPFLALRCPAPSERPGWAADWQPASQPAANQAKPIRVNPSGHRHVPLFSILFRGRTEPALQAGSARPVPRQDEAIREQRPVLEEKDTSVVAAQYPEQTPVFGRSGTDGARETLHARS